MAQTVAQKAVEVNASVSRNVMLAGSDQRTVFILIELVKLLQQAQGLSRSFRVAVDVSGSTGDPAAPNSKKTKLQVIKEGLVDVVQDMPETDQFSAVGFDNDFHRIQKTGSLKLIRQEAIIALKALQPLGSTKLSDALRHAVVSYQSGFITVAHLGTDGLVNAGGPDERNLCLRIMREANAVPVWILGLGAEYDPDFLQELAANGKNGTFFMHVSNAFDYAKALRQQLQLLVSMGDVTDVKIEADALGGATILEATRLVPDNDVFATNVDSVSYDHGALDLLGQRILLKLQVPAQSLYAVGGEKTYNILHFRVSFNSGGQQVEEGDLGVEITADETKHKNALNNGTVMTTVYTAAGQMNTMLGDLQQAATMFTMAGQTQIAHDLQTLSSGGMQDENDQRALLTKVNFAGSGLNTLSS